MGIRHALCCTALAAAAGLVRASVPGESLLIDEEAMMPSAAEIQDAQKAWAERTVRTTPEENHAHIRALWSSSARGSARRSVQETSASSASWKYDPSLLRGAMYTELDGSLADGAGSRSVCSDVLATNAGASGHCIYDCATLKQHYFSSAESECFIVEDPQTASWPSELMSKRQDVLDFEVLLQATNVFPAAFRVGVGRGCRNVTIQSTMLGGSDASPATHVETRCLQPGHHTHVHQFTEPHTVEIVGYASATYDPGNSNDEYTFVVGDCTDTIVRVTTFEGSSAVMWSIDDGAHNGPWSFETPRGPGVHEYPSCMFDNNFTLTQESGGEDWIGNVAVVSTVEDKTIIIPPNENWILQGAEVDGVPVVLDARLKSGDAYPRPGIMSTANIVVRYVRFTSQQATLDPHSADRTHSTSEPNSLGGVLEFTGGWGSEIVFEKCVFDHLFASSGGAIFIDGQMDEWAREPNLRLPEELVLTVKILDCLAWQNEAAWAGGVMRIVDAYPLNLTIHDTQFVDNFGTIASAAVLTWHSSIFDRDENGTAITGIQGQSHYDLQRIEVTGVSPAQEAADGTKRYEQSPFNWVGFGGHWPVGPGTDRPDVMSFINVEQMVCHDISMSAQPCLIAYHLGECAGGCWNMSISDSEFYNAYGTQATTLWSSHALTYWAETLEMSRTRFNHVGLDENVVDAVCEGVVSSSTTRLSRFVNISMINGYTARGGALAIATLGGRGVVEVIGSLFQGNRALRHGGALYSKSRGSLLIYNSQFLMNTVRINIEVHVDVVVHVFTGSSGHGARTLPVWKLDGQEPSHEDGSCGDDVVYGNSTYEVESTYAHVITTTAGPHRLWYGLVLNDPNKYSGWPGGGWIDVMGVQTKIYPEIVDNRATAGPNGEPARALGCFQATRTEVERSYCPEGQAFWSSTEIFVPYGNGGGVATVGEGSVEIRDTIFTQNDAGRGEDFSVVGSSDLKIVGTTFAPLATVNTGFTEGVPPYECASHPCEPGYGCSFSQLSLFCTKCGRDQFSTDGRWCQRCEPGTQSTDNRTACVTCPEGTYSSAGSCQRCDLGRVSSADRKTCVDCPAGQAAGQGVSCEACALSHFASSGQLFCEECPPGQTHTIDRSGCIPCAISGDFEATAQPVRPAGTPYCTLCPDGTVAGSDGASCEACIEPGQVSLSGLACTDCADGTQPNANRSRCVACAPGTAGLRGVCASCVAGKQASPSGHACVDCPTGRYSLDGTACVACLPGFQPNLDQSACESCVLYENAVSFEGDQCTECPSRETPNADKTVCVCAPGFYSVARYGPLECVDETGINDDGNFGLLDSCATCPNCLECDEGEAYLKPGWAFYGAGTAYRCPVDIGCPGGAVQNISTAQLTWSGDAYSEAVLDAQCEVGYTGPVCGQCDDDWNHLKVGAPCEPCDDGRLDVSMALLTLAAAFVAGGVVVSGFFRVLKDNGVVTDARLVIGFYQKLSQMSDIIDFTFPAPVPWLAEVVKILFLDVRNIIHLDCWDVGGLDGKITTNLAVVPLLFICACFALRANQRRTIGFLIQGGAADESAYTAADVQLKNNLFFGVFLLYPTITSTLFRIPQCRQIGDHWYHEDDFSVECKGSFFGLVAFAVVIIVLIPVGVPTLLLFAMRNAKNRLGGVRMTALGGAKLTEEDDDERDPFGFLIRDLKPEFWYYEVVIFARKLLLGGVSIVVGRGTMAQAYFVCAVESLFLMYFLSSTHIFGILHKHNLVDGLGHCALILTYMVILILRKNDPHAFEAEWFPREGYGWFIVFLYVVLLPSPTIYYYLKGSPKKTKAEFEFESSISEFENNPLANETVDEPARSDDDTTVPSSRAGPKHEPPAPISTAERIEFAKILRRSKEQEAENQNLRTEVKELRASLASAGGDVNLVAADQLLVAKPKSKRAGKDPQTNQVKSADGHKSEDLPFVKELRAFATDDLLREETRAAAQLAVDAAVTNQLDLNQYKQDVAQRVTKKKLLAEEIQQTKAVNLQLSSQHLEMLRQRNAKAFQVAQDTRERLRLWLGEARLMRHEDTLIEVCGEDLAVDDLQHLRQEDLDQITANMSFVEAKRLTDGIGQLKSATGNQEGAQNLSSD